MLADPDFEVKMLADAGETLNSKGEPRRKVREEFRIERSTKAVMLFLDSDARSLNETGWIVRIRAFDDEDDLQLTYKKRFAIPGDGEGDIAVVHDQARGEGFGDAPEKYDAQVEWGRDDLTLTASLKASGGPRDTGALLLPGADDVRQIALSAVPSVLEQQQPERARALLETAHVYGPVFGERWIGTWHDDEVFIEVWTVRRAPDTDETEQLVEISLKKKRHESAGKRHRSLRKLLDKKDWMAGEQRSKTEIILERY